MKKICKNAVKAVIVITAKKKKKNKLHNCHFHLQKKRHFSLLEEVREFYLLLCLSQQPHTVSYTVKYFERDYQQQIFTTNKGKQI